VLDGHPAGRGAEADPLPFRPSAAGCAYSARGFSGGVDGLRRHADPQRSVGRPAQPRALAHVHLRGARRPARGPDYRDVGPVDEAAAAELADRRERWQAALEERWRLPAGAATSGTG
jgi:hypothetical protein